MLQASLALFSYVILKLIFIWIIIWVTRSKPMGQCVITTLAYVRS